MWDEEGRPGKWNHAHIHNTHTNTFSNTFVHTHTHTHTHADAGNGGRRRKARNKNTLKNTRAIGLQYLYLTRSLGLPMGSGGGSVGHLTGNVEEIPIHSKGYT